MGNSQKSRVFSLSNEETAALQNLADNGSDHAHKGASLLPENITHSEYHRPMYKISEDTTKFGIALRSSSMIGLLHTMLAGSEVDLEEVSSFIFTWLVNNNTAFQLRQVQSEDGRFYHEIYGYIFQDATFILFKMEYFRREVDKLLGIDVKQLEGEGFVLGSFFSVLFSDLAKAGHAAIVSADSSEFGNETEDLDDFCYSSDEEEESTTNAIENRFLQLSRSPKLILNWVETLGAKRSYADVINALLLFAHNCAYPPNIKLIVETITPQWGNFLKIVLSRMIDSNNLPIVYSCCKILYHISATGHALTITWDDFGALCNILKHWSTARPFTLQNPVSKCPEIQRDLIFIISNFETPETPPNPSQLLLISALRDLDCPDSVRLDLNKLLDKLDVQKWE